MTGKQTSMPAAVSPRGNQTPMVLISMPLGAVFTRWSEPPPKSRCGSGPVRCISLSLICSSHFDSFRLLTNIQEINTGRVPSGVTDPGSPSIETSQWGTPVARFTNSRCDIARKFGPENVIINLTFCAYLLHPFDQSGVLCFVSDPTILPGGDWAGNPDVYASSGCPSTCVGAYREFQKLHVVE